MVTTAKRAPDPQKIMLISVDIIDSPEIPARIETMDEGIEELAASIKQLGLIEPLIVKVKGKKYEVVAGDRRLRAARLAGIQRVPALVTPATGKKAEQMKIHENLFRRDLNPAEEAILMQRLMAEFKIKQAALAKMMNKSEGYVSQRLDMLNWPESLLRAVNDGKVQFSVGRELMRIENEGAREYYIDTVVRSGANLDQVKSWVTVENAPKQGAGKEADGTPAGDDTVPPPPYKPQCFVCEEHFEVSDTITVQLCRTCGKAMRDSLKGGGK